MQKNFTFQRHASAEASSGLLNKLEGRLKHPVFGEASVNVQIEPRESLATGLTATSFYGNFSINACYIPGNGRKGNHVEVSVDISDSARDEIYSAIKNALKDIFNYQIR